MQYLVRDFDSHTPITDLQRSECAGEGERKEEEGIENTYVDGRLQTRLDARALVCGSDLADGPAVDGSRLD